jgi:predicted class III extradiol MEMO1 family dioxygenase
VDAIETPFGYLQVCNETIKELTSKFEFIEMKLIDEENEHSLGKF